MEQMIGCNELKLHASEMLQLLFVGKGKTDGHTLHTVITSIPGSGKTTGQFCLQELDCYWGVEKA